MGKKVYSIFLLILLGIIYLFIVKVFKIAIPCIFRAVTGLYCPGCGITRLIVFLSKGEFYKAFRSNMAIFTLSPVILYLVVKSSYGYITGKNKLSKFDNYLIYFLIVVLIVFMILRNINYFSYLQPMY